MLAAPETCWILAGLLSLTLRLPFNLAMPHFISTAIAATLEVPPPSNRSTLFLKAKLAAVRASSRLCVLSRDEMGWEGRSLRWQIVHTHDPAGLVKVEECVKGFFVAALCNAALDFFNWNFFVVAQQRMIRRCDPLHPALVKMMGVEPWPEGERGEHDTAGFGSACSRRFSRRRWLSSTSSPRATSSAASQRTWARWPTTSPGCSAGAWRRWSESPASRCTSSSSGASRVGSFPSPLGSPPAFIDGGLCPETVHTQTCFVPRVVD